MRYNRYLILPIFQIILFMVEIFNVTICHVKAQSERCSISGVILDSLTHNPIEGVFIMAGSNTVISDVHGQFRMMNLCEGKMNLSVVGELCYRALNMPLILKKDTTITVFLSRAVVNMEEVVITGTRTIKRLSEAPVLTTLISSKELSFSGSVSILESLQDNIPGIVISPNAMGNNFRIRGLNSRYVLFLVDGERLVSEGAGGNVNLDRQNVDNIERIELINGAASALYGSNAVGAVVNVITKKPSHKLEGRAGVSTQSCNTWKTNLYIGSCLGKVGMDMSAFRNSSDGFGADGTGVYAAKYEDWGGAAKVAYQFSKALEMKFIGRYFMHETFNPESSLNTSHALTRTFTVCSVGSYTSPDKRNVLTLSFNFDKYLDYNVLEIKKNLKNKQNSADYLSGRLLETLTLNKKIELVGGLEYNRESNYAVKTLGTTPTIKNVNDANVFAQLEYKPFFCFDIVGGARYTYNSQFKSAFTPKLSLLYRLNHFNFRAGVGTAFRAPTIKELYYNFDHQGMFWIYGNPDLMAEKGLYCSLSAEYSRKYINISITGYYNNIDHKITQYDVLTESGEDEKHYKNVSSATLYGGDLNFTCDIRRFLTIKGSYSYCNAKDNATGLQLEDNVNHSATMSVTWNGKITKSPFFLQFAGRVNSPILYQEVMTDLFGNQIYQLTESKTYSIWKLVLVKPFYMKNHTLTLTLKCDNLFDFKDSAFIDPGRQYYVEIKYMFN